MHKAIKQIHQRLKFRTQASNTPYHWDYIEQLIIENEQNRKEIKDLKKACNILMKICRQQQTQLYCLDLEKEYQADEIKRLDKDTDFYI